MKKGSALSRNIGQKYVYISFLVKFFSLTFLYNCCRIFSRALLIIIINFKTPCGKETWWSVAKKLLRFSVVRLLVFPCYPVCLWCWCTEDCLWMRLQPCKQVLEVRPGFIIGNQAVQLEIRLTLHVWIGTISLARG